MRIAIANPTGGGISGGYQKYLNRLVPEIETHEAVSSLRVFVPASLIGRLSPDLPLTAVTGNDWAAAIADFRPDVVFVPTARTLPTGGVPLVTMMRNMEPVTVPFAGNTVKESLRNVGRAAVALRACRSADRVIAVSDFVAGFLRDTWRVSPDRIGIVSHGVDRPSPEGQWSQPRAVVDSQAPFLFAAGSIRPVRGLRGVIDAFAEVSAGYARLRLVIAGRPTPDAMQHLKSLHARAEAIGVADRIDWVGSLEADEMAWCYGHAKVFVMNSRAEACPNVALEALSHGCLVVSTKHNPMPEFFGDAAVYVERENDSAALSAALRAVLESPDRFSQLRDQATTRAGRYTWAATAQRTVEELEHATRVTATRRGA